MVAEVFADRAALSFDGQTGVHNAELMAAFGADVIVLNMIDRVWDGVTFRFPGLGELSSLRELAERIGRPIGVNVEPGMVPDLRKATAENARRLADAGAALIVLTANPSTDGSLDGMARATEEIRTEAALWVGKMHHAGHPEPITAAKLTRLVDAGADGVILPIPGTLPGVTRRRPPKPSRRCTRKVPSSWARSGRPRRARTPTWCRSSRSPPRRSASTRTTSATASCRAWAIPSCCTPTRSRSAGAGTRGPGWRASPTA